MENLKYKTNRIFIFETLMKITLEICAFVYN